MTVVVEWWFAAYDEHDGDQDQELDVLEQDGPLELARALLEVQRLAVERIGLLDQNVDLLAALEDLLW